MFKCAASVCALRPSENFNLLARFPARRWPPPVARLLRGETRLMCFKIFETASVGHGSVGAVTCGVV